jgi:hypothetical protein
MDTDINNYNIDEIFRIVKVDKDCKLEQVYDTIKNTMNKLDASNKPNVYEYKHFFRECFKRIALKQGYAVPDYIYKELGIIKLDSKLPEVNNVKNTSGGQKIVDPKNYPGAVPEVVPDDLCVNTTITQYPRGIVNPIKRETIKNLLTINSKFRDDIFQMTTDFSTELNDVYNNVVSIKLASLEFFNSYYTFSNYLMTNTFKIITYEYTTATGAIVPATPATQTIEFPEGNYSPADLVTLLNSIFIVGPPALAAVQAVYNTAKGKIYFRINPASLPPGPGLSWGFDLDFKVIEPCNNRELYNNFGWLVGFREEKYTFFEDYKTIADTQFEIGYNPEAFINTKGTSYYLLEVNDYNKNVSEVLKYNTSHIYSFNIHDILAKVPNNAQQTNVLFEDSSDRIFKSRQYFGPVKINKLQFRLLDENGKTVNLNNADLTISLEIESLDSPYKNMI